MSDRIFGGIGILLALFYAWRATLIQTSFINDAVGPKTFPFVIAAVLGLASLYCLLRPDPAPEWPRLGRLAEIALAALVMLAYAKALPEIGFVIATTLASAYLTWRLGSPPLQSVVIGVVTAGALYGIFGMLFGLTLARGPLGF